MSDNPYGNVATEWVQPVFALRTFVIHDGQLDSVVQSGGGHWIEGECRAVCLRGSDDEAPAHEAPAQDCHCGIYGAFSLRALRRQYGEEARWIVTVIQCEGAGMRGPVGLRAARALVVAFWCPEPDDEHRDDIRLCLEQFPYARQYHNDQAMARAYRIGGT